LNFRFEFEENDVTNSSSKYTRRELKMKKEIKNLRKKLSEIKINGENHGEQNHIQNHIQNHEEQSHEEQNHHEMNGEETKVNLSLDSTSIEDSPIQPQHNFELKIQSDDLITENEQLVEQNRFLAESNSELNLTIKKLQDQLNDLQKKQEELEKGNQTLHSLDEKVIEQTSLLMTEIDKKNPFLSDEKFVSMRKLFQEQIIEEKRSKIKSEEEKKRFDKKSCSTG